MIITVILDNVLAIDKDIYKTVIDGYTILLNYSYRLSYDGSKFILKNIRIDEPGESTGSGHAVSGPRNVSIHLLNAYNINL